MNGVGFFLGVVAVLSALLAVKIGFIGMALWYHLAYPDASKRMLVNYTERPRRCVLVGVLNLAVGIFIMLILLNAPPLRLLGVLIFVCLVSIAVIGYGPAYRVMGARLASEDESKPDWKVLLIGGVASEAAFLAPFAGQLLSFVTLLRGFGAVVLTMLARSKAHDAAVNDSGAVAESNSTVRSG